MKKLVVILLALFAGLGVADAQDNSSWFGRHDFEMWESYVQYVPIAADLALSLCGVETDRRFLSVVVAASAGAVAHYGICQGLKYAVNEPRPDGGEHSFPSGHTATAFLGAELVRSHYGWGWGAGAYCAATAVGVARVVHQRHYWWDVAAGAVIGIGSAHIGNLVSDWLITPSVDPVSGTPTLAFCYTF